MGPQKIVKNIDHNTYAFTNLPRSSVGFEGLFEFRLYLITMRPCLDEKKKKRKKMWCLSHTLGEC
jgi:hypothetical protein